MTSDTTGEIYVIVKAGGGPLDSARPAGSATRTGGDLIVAIMVTSVSVLMVMS